MLPSNGRAFQQKNNYHMTVEELKILLIHTRKKYGLQHFVMPLIQYIMGMRSSELCAIHLTDFSAGFTRLTYRNAKTNDVKYHEPVPEELALVIKEYVHLNSHRMRNGFLFPVYTRLSNTHLTAHTYETFFCDWRQEIGKECPKFLDHYKIITLSWYICRELKNKNLSLKKLAKNLGRNEGDVRRICKSLIKQKKIIKIGNFFKLTEKGILFQEKEDYVIRYRIASHSLRRLHRTTLKNNIEDLWLVKELCGYKDWESFQRYINVEDIHIKKERIVNNVLGPLVNELLTGNSKQIRLNHFT